MENQEEIVIENPDAPQAEQPPKQEPPKTEAQAAQEKKNYEANLIPIDKNGKVMARNNSELIRYCGALVNGSGVPKRFDSPTKLFAALMFARDLGLPDTAIRQIADVKGTMSIFGDLPLALAQRSKELKNFREQWFDKEYKVINFENQNLDAEVWGAVCFLSRGEGVVQSFSFTMDDAEKAGLYPAKADMPWMKYTRLMLRYKARSIALKSLFADTINGVAIAEYDFDETIETAGVRDISDVASDKATGFREEIRTQGA